MMSLKSLKMNSSKFTNTNKPIVRWLFLLPFLMLFVSFQFNFFDVADDEWVRTH